MHLPLPLRPAPLLILLLLVSITLPGCSTRLKARLEPGASRIPIRAVAHVPGEDNSAEMDGHLREALEKEGVRLLPAQPVGRDAPEGVDAFIRYVDVWRWDVAMYLSRIDVTLTDPRSGRALATATWKDSPLHMYRNSEKAMRRAVEALLDEARLEPSTAEEERPVPEGAQPGEPVRAEPDGAFRGFNADPAG